MKKLLVIHNKYRDYGEDIAVNNEVVLLKEKFIVMFIFCNDIKNYFFKNIYFLINENFQSLKQIENKINEYKLDVVYIHNTWFKVLAVLKL